MITGILPNVRYNAPAATAELRATGAERAAITRPTVSAASSDPNTGIAQASMAPRSGTSGA